MYKCHAHEGCSLWADVSGEWAGFATRECEKWLVALSLYRNRASSKAKAHHINLGKVIQTKIREHRAAVLATCPIGH